MQFTNDNRKAIKANTNKANSAAADRRLIRGDIRGIRDDIEKNKQRVANNTRRIGRNERRMLENSADVDYIMQETGGLTRFSQKGERKYFLSNATYLTRNLSRGSGAYWPDKRNYYSAVEKRKKEKKGSLGLGGNTPYGRLF